MYSRTKGADTFGVSGKLWREALVMYDRETDTLWSQIDGRAIRGDRKGQRLEVYPSVMMTWKEWVKRYPETQVLAKDERARRMTQSVYADYFQDGGKIGVRKSIPELQKETGLASKEKLLGLSHDTDAIGLPFSRLKGHPVVHAQLAERPIVIAFDEAADTARAFWAGTAEAPRTFTARRSDAGLQLVSGDDVYDALTGRRLEGEGPELAPLPSQVSYWYAWYSFFPRTRLWSPEAGAVKKR